MTEHTAERIAVALERSVEQHDEHVVRALSLRDENIRKHDLQRDEELTELRATNARLIDQLDQILAHASTQRGIYEAFEQRVRALELALSVDAVDPVGGIVADGPRA